MNQIYYNLKNLLIVIKITTFIGVTQINAQNANGLAFDGTDDYLQISSYPAITTQYTMMAWIKTNSTTLQTLFGWGSTSSTQASFLRISGSTLETVQANIAISGTSAIQTNQWTHVALTRNGNNFKIYVNGILDGSGTQNAYTGVNVFTIGNMFYNGSNYFRYNGVMDNFSLWDTELSEAQISSYKDSELTGTETNLVLDYNFNQGTSNGNNNGISTVTDNSTNSNDANMNNFTMSGTSSNFTAGTTLDIQNSDLIKFNVFPNPVSNELTIVSKNQSNLEVSVFNISGKKIIENINSENNLEIKINTQSLKSGAYILEIKSNDNITHKKIIKL